MLELFCFRIAILLYQIYRPMLPVVLKLPKIKDQNSKSKWSEITKPPRIAFTRLSTAFIPSELRAETFINLYPKKFWIENLLIYWFSWKSYQLQCSIAPSTGSINIPIINFTKKRRHRAFLGIKNFINRMKTRETARANVKHEINSKIMKKSIFLKKLSTSWLDSIINR